MRRPRPTLWLGALLVLVGVVWLVDRLVVTDEEALEELVEAAAEAIRSDDPDALERTLTPDFEASGKDRAETVQWIGRKWRRYRPIGLEVEVLQVEIEGDEATLRAVGSMAVMARRVLVEVDLDAVRTAEGWRFARARHRVSVGAGSGALR